MIACREPFLRHSELIFSWPPVWIDKLKTIISLLEGVAGVVIDGLLVCKSLEDLLKSGLRYRVLLDSKLSLLNLKLTKEPSNCAILLGYTELEKLTALLENLNLVEVRGQELYDRETLNLSCEVFK